MTRSIEFTLELLCAGLAIFAVIVAAIGVFDMVVVSGLTVLLALLICFFRMEHDKSQESPNKLRLALHGLMVLALVYIFWEWGVVMFEQEETIISISLRQNAFAWVAIALITYLTYRFFGIPMLAVVAVSAAYLLLPSTLGGAGVGWKHAVENLWFSSDGVFGRPVEVVSRTVLVFIVFGAVLQQSGAGEMLLKIALAATGRFAGGPAHAAVAASALFGSLSGTAVANVVSTGVFTIPIIKKIGFKPSFAGGVEAAASTGGQIMPPVMGVVAFLMADITGIPYLKIIVAALIPSIMYYTSLFIVIFIEAKRLGIEALPRKERVGLTRDDLVKSLALVIPLGVIIAVLITGRTAQNAGFYALISAFVLCLVLFPDFRRPAKWWRALIDSGKTCADSDCHRQRHRFCHRGDQHDRHRPHVRRGRFVGGLQQSLAGPDLRHALLPGNGHGSAHGRGLPDDRHSAGARLAEAGAFLDGGSPVCGVFRRSECGYSAGGPGGLCRRPHRRGQSHGDRLPGHPPGHSRFHHPLPVCFSSGHIARSWAISVSAGLLWALFIFLAVHLGDSHCAGGLGMEQIAPLADARFGCWRQFC